MTYASIRRAYINKLKAEGRLTEEMTAAAIPGKDIPLGKKKPKRRKKYYEELIFDGEYVVEKTDGEPVVESKGLLGKNLVAFLTNICLEEWYGLVRKFSGNPDTYDVHASAPHPQFETFKMTPGNDKRDDAYAAILGTAASITKGLNAAFGKEVFEQRVSRNSGALQVLVAFAAGKGGVFQCKAENNGGDSAINLTMPNREELIRAFSAMTDTPHPGDELDSLSDEDIPSDPVAGDIPPPNAEADMGGEQVPTPEAPQPDPGQEPIPDGQSTEDDLVSRRRFESMRGFFGKVILEDKKWKVTWLDNRGIAQSHTVVSQTASGAKMKTMQDRRQEMPANPSFATEEIIADPNAPVKEETEQIDEKFAVQSIPAPVPYGTPAQAALDPSLKPVKREPVYGPYLTTKEAELLRCYVANNGNWGMLTTGIVLAHLYGAVDVPDDKIVDVFRSKIEKKLNISLPKIRYQKFGIYYQDEEIDRRILHRIEDYRGGATAHADEIMHAMGIKDDKTINNILDQWHRTESDRYGHR